MKKLFLFVALMLVFAVSAVQAQQDNLKYVPLDSDFIMSINFKQLLSDPDVKKTIEESIAKSEKNKKDFEEFKEKTGIDIFNDLDSAMIFTAGKSDPKNPDKQLAGAILNVKNNKEKILNGVKNDEKAAKDVEIGKIGDFDAILPKDKKEGAGVFIDDKTIAVGTTEGITYVANIAKGTAKNVSARADFATVIAKMNKAATLAGAGLVPAELKANMKNNPNAEPFSTVKYFVFDFTKGENIIFNLLGEVENKSEVDKVAATINAYLVMLRQFASSSPEALSLVNQIKVTTENTSVKVSFNVKKSQIEEIRKKIEAQTKESEGKAGRE